MVRSSSSIVGYFFSLAAASVVLPSAASAWSDGPMCAVPSTQGWSRGLVSVSQDDAMCRSDFVSWLSPTLTPTILDDARARTALNEARLAIDAGDADRARLELDLAEHGLPYLSDRFALMRGNLEMQMGDYESAAESFDLARSSIHENVRVEAENLRVRALIAVDPSEAERALLNLMRVYPGFPDQDSLWLGVAVGYQRLDDTENARRVFREILRRYPSTSTAKRALRELGNSKEDQELAQQAQGDLIQRLEILFFRGPVSDARRELNAALADADKLDAPTRVSLYLLAAQNARREAKWKQAAQFYTLALKDIDRRDPNFNTAERRHQDAERTVLARDKAAALRSIQKLQRKRKLYKVPVDTRVEMLRHACSAEITDKADEILQSLIDSKPSSEQRLAAATTAAGLGSDKLLIELLQPIASSSSRSPLSARYQMARAIERSGEKSRAVDMFKAMVNDTKTRTDDEARYYNMWSRIALDRLGASENKSTRVANKDTKKPELNAEDREKLWRKLYQQLAPIAAKHESAYPWLQRSADLLQAGFVDEARIELYRAYVEWKASELDRPSYWGMLPLAQLPQSMDCTRARNRSAETRLSDEERIMLSEISMKVGSFGSAYGWSLKKDVEKLIQPYREQVYRAAKANRLDPELLFAVMRVESVFQRDILSHVGAIGLMQIMPRTGYLIAAQRSIPDFHPVDLLNPALNIDFAAWYLRSLIDRFDGQIPLAIAAYNGGPGNVQRWLHEHHRNVPLDAFLERIPYRETNRYVRRVLANYDRYREQDQQPNPKLSLRTPAPSEDTLGF